MYIVTKEEEEEEDNFSSTPLPVPVFFFPLRTSFLVTRVRKELEYGLGEAEGFVVVSESHIDG